MKVLSFIEYTNLTFIESHEYFIPFETFLSKHIKWSENEDGDWDILKFYSQPFKPELITELFEGWETKDFSLYKNDNSHRDIRFNDGITYNFELNDFIEENNYYPRTLDDFINDCQRAGIELEWRVK